MTAQGTAQGSWSQLESEQGHDTLGWTGQEHLVHKGPKRTTINERSCLHQQRATVSAPSPFNRINTYLLIYFVRCLENYLSPRQLSLGPHEIMDNCSLLCCPLQYFCWLWTHQNPCHMGRKHKVTLHGEKRAQDQVLDGPGLSLVWLTNGWQKANNFSEPRFPHLIPRL